MLVVVLDVKKNNKRERQNSTLRLHKSNYGAISQSIASDADNTSVNASTNGSNIVNTDSLESSTFIAPLGQVPSAGTWERDITGNYLSRFVVLILFLLFSCLVVSTVAMVTLYVHGYIRVFLWCSGNWWIARSTDYL